MGKIIYRFFISMKLTITLILILTILSLLGIFLPQISGELSNSADGYSWWLENVAQKKFGSFSEVLAFWGFFNIFHSFWFLGAFILLLINILACSINRFKGLKRRSRKIQSRKNIDFYKKGSGSYETKTKMAVENTYSTVIKILKGHNYNPVQSETEGSIYIAGDKNRFSAFGTYLVHLSLFLLITGILLGNFLGFRNNQFIVPEGSRAEVGNNTGLVVKLKSFSDQYWEDGTPKDYRSKLVLYENDSIAEEGIVRVNHPFSYRGIRFYQSFYGPAVRLKISDADNDLLFDDSVALSRMVKQQREGNFRLSAGDTYFVNLIDDGISNRSVMGTENSVKGADNTEDDNGIIVELYDSNFNLIDRGGIKEGLAGRIGKLTFILTDKIQYSGFIVVKDPGTIFIWIGSLIFLAGLIIVFYFPESKVWIALKTSHGNNIDILVKLKSSKKFNQENELSSLISELEDKLK